MFTNQKQIRAAFWQEHPGLDDEARARRTRSKGQNAQTTDTRCTFCDWLDTLHRDGQVSDALAQRATL
jgi:hypothetical protein